MSIDYLQKDIMSIRVNRIALFSIKTAHPRLDSVLNFVVLGHSAAVRPMRALSPKFHTTSEEDFSDRPSVV